jgi:hypothetical protein
MKISEAISKLDLTKGQPTHDIDSFSESLGVLDHLGYSEEFSKRVTCYSVQDWLCTDTVVGTFVYYMDGLPVALSIQTARKTDKEIWFLSKEAAQKMREFIQSVMPDHYEPEIVSLDEELPDFSETHNYPNSFFSEFGQRVS